MPLPATITRRELTIAGGGFAAAFAGALVLGGSWVYADSKPHLSVLGCGSSLALFLTSGGARVLVIGEGSSADFANAFSRARRPGLSRIDILLVDSLIKNITLPGRVSTIANPRRTMSLGDSSMLLNAGLRIDDAVVSPRSIELPAGVRLTVDPQPVPGTEEQSGSGWLGQVEYERSSFVLAKNQDALEHVPSPPNGSILILLQGAVSAPTLNAIGPQAVIVSSRGMSGSELRSTIAESGRELFGYRIFPGDLLGMTMQASGVSLPSTHVGFAIG